MFYLLWSLFLTFKELQTQAHVHKHIHTSEYKKYVANPVIFKAGITDLPYPSASSGIGMAM